MNYIQITPMNEDIILPEILNNQFYSALSSVCHHMVSATTSHGIRYDITWYPLRHALRHACVSKTDKITTSKQRVCKITLAQG